MTPWVRFTFLLATTALFLAASPSFAETDDEEYQDEPQQYEEPAPPPPPQRRRDRKGERKKHFVPDIKRTDAGIFHVAAVVGGNFYTEPKVTKDASGNLTSTGEYFKDFGFQAGVIFDYDYSEMDENIPLSLRGMIGYKYVLSSVHVFSFDGAVRRMFRFSDAASFGLGLGASAAVWYRSITASSPDEEIIFLPSVYATAGFDFTPFMVEFKWLVNRFGEDSTITGLELYFGFRL